MDLETDARIDDKLTAPKLIEGVFDPQDVDIGQNASCHLDRVFEIRVLFQMMIKGKPSMKMHGAMSAKEREINIRV
ncbi:MAG: hypothetical protein NTU60_10615 [Candidatus Aminicenantes bacterium]|nr:hypothetical protein [Candidatus Aminicenantes bacterium]